MRKATALQAAVLIMYAILTACHLLLVYASLARTSSMQNPFVYLEVLVILVSFVCWVCVIAADTSVEAKQCCSISKAFSVVGHLQTPNSRYCSVCAKNTLGMDHHCLWLNCCIGRCNYRSFLAVLVSVVFQMLLQVVFGLLALVEGAIRHNKTYLNAARQFSGEDLYILEILLAADIIVSATAFVFLASLLLFHVYLIHCRKISTYEWVVRRRYKVSDIDEELRERSANERIRQAERDEWQAKTECSKITIVTDSTMTDTMS